MSRRKRLTADQAGAIVEKLTARLLRVARALEEARRAHRLAARRERDAALAAPPLAAPAPRLTDAQAIRLPPGFPGSAEPVVCLFRPEGPRRPIVCGRLATGDPPRCGEHRAASLEAHLKDVHPTRPGTGSCPRGACGRDHHHDERPNADLDAAFGMES